MGKSFKTGALRWLAVACAFGCLNLPTSLRAATLHPAPSTALIERSNEPFGLAVTALSEGGLREKWRGVQRELDIETILLALCEADRAHCPSAAALQFLDIADQGKAREGRARLGEINRAVNLAIRPMSDLVQHGVVDQWSSPLATLAAGAGDCEDYAIAKLVALRWAGVSPDDLRLIVLHDTLRGEDHAVVAARLDGRWLTLDNRRMAMVEDAQVANYRPLFMIDSEGIKRYEEPSLVARGDSIGASQEAADLGASPL